MNYINKIFFLDCAWEDKCIVFPSNERNAICRMERDGSVSRIATFPGEKDGVQLFCGIYRIETGKYMFCPRYSEKKAIVIFDSNENQFEYLDIDKQIADRIIFNGKRVYKFGDYYYIVSVFDYLLKVNINKREIEYIHLLKEGRFGETICVDQNIYIVCQNSNKIIMFSIEDEDTKSFSLEGVDAGIDTITYVNGFFWLSGSMKLIKWIPNNIIKEISLPLIFEEKELGEEKNLSRWFDNSVSIEDRVYLFPGFYQNIVCLNVDTESLSEIIVENEKEDTQSLERPGRYSKVKYCCVKHHGSEVLFVSFKNKTVNIYDEGKMKVIFPKWKDIKEGKIPISIDSLMKEDEYNNSIDNFILNVI